MVLDGGAVHPTGTELDCLVVDFSEAVIGHMHLPEPFAEIMHRFDPDHPFALPDPAHLMPLVTEWILSA